MTGVHNPLDGSLETQLPEGYFSSINENKGTGLVAGILFLGGIRAGNLSTSNPLLSTP